ncbi:MAG TPA: hypothetical protein DEA08_29830 [Planctomycetes bacterium]|nr:hypothetical protein [Planctomycetota bacterium]
MENDAAAAVEFMGRVPQALLEADGFDIPLTLLEGPTLELTWERFFGIPCVCPPLAATEVVEELELAPGYRGILRRHPDPEIQASTIRYAYSLAVELDGIRRPRFWLTSELNLNVPGEGAFFLCAFDQGTHYNWGGEDRWGELEAFREEALSRVRYRIAAGSFARTGATVTRPEGVVGKEPDDALWPFPQVPPSDEPPRPEPAPEPAPAAPRKRGPARSRRRLEEAKRAPKVPHHAIGGLLLLAGLICAGLAYFVHIGFALLACLLIFAASAALQ